MKLTKRLFFTLLCLFVLFFFTGCELEDTMNEEFGKVDTQITELVNENEEINSSIEKLNSDMDLKISTLDETYKGLIEDLELIIETNKKSIEELTKKHNEDINSLTNDYQNKIKELDDQLTNDKTELQKDYETKINNLNTEFNNKVATLENDISSNQKQIASLTTKLDSEIDNVKKDYQSKIDELKKTYDTNFETMNKLITSLSNDNTTNKEDIQTLKDKVSNLEKYEERISKLEEVVQYHVTFVYDNGDEDKIVEVEKLKNIDKPNDPIKTGYTFLGWFNEYNEEWIFGGYLVNRDITLTAKWQINSYTITFNTDGGTNVNSITQEYGSTIVTPSNPTKTDYIFIGWDTTIPSTMPAGDLTIKASWIKKYEESGITYIEMGSFPQTHVNDLTLISKLNELTTTNSNGYYEYEGCEYCKVNVNINSISTKYSTGDNIAIGETWFKVEPIKWRVLETSNNEYTLMSEYLLTTKQFDTFSSDYSQSDIREYLFNEFYNNTFNNTEKTVIIENCNVNNDKACLLSVSDVTNTGYGFETTFDECDSRISFPTDYALAMNATLNISSGASSWWLLTVASDSMVYYVDVVGRIFDGGVNMNSLCIRPKITIKINQ